MKRPLKRIATAVLIAAGTTLGQAGDWTEFRGSSKQGLSDETRLPEQWNATENVAWKTPVPGLGWSSPIVVDQRVLLTTAIADGEGDEADQSLRTLCFDAETGRLLWNVEVFLQEGQETKRIHGKNSHASPTPVSDGRHVFVHFGANGTACLTLDGEMVWATQALRYVPRHGNGGSPTLFDDLLVVSCDGYEDPFVAALDRASGEIRWKQARPPVANPSKFSFTTPLVIHVDGKPQIISPGSDVVIAYEPKTGSEIWRVEYDGFSVVPRPVFGHGLIYMCTGWTPPKLLAIRPDGKGNVTETHIEWQLAKAVPNTPSLLLLDEEIYMVSDRGIATCVDAKTGAEHWQERLGGSFSASPIYGAGLIYFVSEDGDTTVVRPGRKFEKVAVNRLEERSLASPAVADSSLFIRTDQHLYRISSPKP